MQKYTAFFSLIVLASNMYGAQAKPSLQERVTETYKKPLPNDLFNHIKTHVDQAMEWAKKYDTDAAHGIRDTHDLQNQLEDAHYLLAIRNTDAARALKELSKARREINGLAQELADAKKELALLKKTAEKSPAAAPAGQKASAAQAAGAGAGRHGGPVVEYDE